MSIEARRGTTFGVRSMGAVWNTLVLASLMGATGCGHRVVNNMEEGGADGSQVTSAASWLRAAGGSGCDLSEGIAVDTSSNVFVTGTVRRAATFETTKLAVGARDIFVAKYSPRGDLLWVKAAGGSTFFNDATGIAVDANGQAIVTGHFKASLTFGTTTLSSKGNGDAFVSKYASDGRVLWARASSNSGQYGARVQTRGVAVDGSGNVYVAGSSQGKVSFGAIALGGGAFLVKYSPQGTVLWARATGGPTVSSMGVSVAAGGHVHLTGNFTGSATFGATTLGPASGQDMYVAKYGPDGEALWAAAAGGPNNAAGMGIAVDLMGQVTVTGHYRGSIGFGGDLLTAAGKSDVFVARYSSAGAILWARSAGSPTGEDCGRAVAVDPLGNSYLTGEFVGRAAFGQTALSSTPSTSYEKSDLFVTKLSPDGRFIWALSAGGPSFDEAGGIRAGAGGTLWVTGSFENQARFAGTPLSSSTCSDLCCRDLFVWRMTKP